MDVWMDRKTDRWTDMDTDLQKDSLSTNTDKTVNLVEKMDSEDYLPSLAETGTQSSSLLQHTKFHCWASQRREYGQTQLSH